MAEQNQLLGLEDLPVFESNPFFRGGRPYQDVPVHEVARITFYETPQSNPPYRRQEILHVVGRSPDSNTIYVSNEAMWRLNDKLIAIPTDLKPFVPRSLIEIYEILIKHTELTKIKEARRI